MAKKNSRNTSTPYAKGVDMHKHRGGRFRPLPELRAFTVRDLTSNRSHEIVGENLKDAISKFAGPALGYVHLGVPMYLRHGRNWYAAYRGEKTNSVERIY